MDSPGPKLPPELEREIFETLAEIDRSSITRIVLVARRCQRWYVSLTLRDKYASFF